MFEKTKNHIAFQPFRFTSFDGTKLFFTTVKSSIKLKQTEKLILLHGAGGDLTALDELREKLAERGYDSIALDLRGYGFSDRPVSTEKYKLDNYAKDLAAFIKNKRLKNVVLIGHCFGGMVAQLYAVKSDNLKALILINTYFKWPQFTHWLTVLPPLTYILRAIAVHLPQFRISKRPDYRKFKNSTDFSPTRIISDILHTSFRSYSLISLAVLEFNIRPLLAKINMPTLVITGTKDRIFKVAEQMELVENIKGARSQFVNGGNHVMVFNKNEEIANAIAKFLQPPQNI